MRASCSTNNHPANKMDEKQKKDLALKIIKNESGVSELASHNQISRKFIYTQKSKSTKAIDDAYKLSRKLGIAKKDVVNFKYYSTNIDTLVSWMHHDVLKMPGSAPAIRYEMYNFILQEFNNLAKLHPHRIKKLCITLENQREQILAFVKVLDLKFTEI